MESIIELSKQVGKRALSNGLETSLIHSMVSVKHSVADSYTFLHVTLSLCGRQLYSKSKIGRIQQLFFLRVLTYSPHIFSHLLEGSLNAQLANL